MRILLKYRIAWSVVSGFSRTVACPYEPGGVDVLLAAHVSSSIHSPRRRTSPPPACRTQCVVSGFSRTAIFATGLEALPRRFQRDWLRSAKAFSTAMTCSFWLRGRLSLIMRNCCPSNDTSYVRPTTAVALTK
jgi:hypothetical protein